MMVYRLISFHFFRFSFTKYLTQLLNRLLVVHPVHGILYSASYHSVRKIAENLKCLVFTLICGITLCGFYKILVVETIKRMLYNEVHECVFLMALRVFITISQGVKTLSWFGEYFVVEESFWRFKAVRK